MSEFGALPRFSGRLKALTPLRLKALVKALFHMFGLGSFGQFLTMAIVLH